MSARNDDPERDYFLQKQGRLVPEFIDFAKQNKRFWLLPLIIVALLLAALLILPPPTPIEPIDYPPP